MSAMVGEVLKVRVKQSGLVYEHSILSLRSVLFERIKLKRDSD